MAGTLTKAETADWGEGFRRWLRRALLGASGQPNWQDHIQEVCATEKEVNLDVFFAPQTGAESPAPHEDAGGTENAQR